MSDLALIKFFPNGISLHLDETAKFSEVLKELGQKFADGANFFGTASMALTVEGRKISEAEMHDILDVIKENSNLHIVCFLEKDEEANKTFVKALGHLGKQAPAPEKKIFYQETLENNAVLQSEESIVLLGDVQEGCSIISERNIIIIGSLQGFACAGCKGDDGAYVLALEMAPEMLKIGETEYINKKKKGKSKIQPKMAVVKNNKIIFDEITKELLSAF